MELWGSLLLPLKAVVVLTGGPAGCDSASRYCAPGSRAYSGEAQMRHRQEHFRRTEGGDEDQV